ncbi:hypothetical protein [Spirosoma luteum]|uniref:hypothetical protein n=1 Tax=Spirosoma luteum TaxID=431553 RepID=UPI0012FC9804|nr:hypothetical protein [Spirosoma luteum]
MAKEELSIPEREAQLLRDTEIGQSARQYVEMEKWAEQQIKNWLPNVDERHLSGSKESAYLKKLGHRALTKGDLLNLVLTFGDEQHKQRITSFKQAQTDLSNRLDKMSNLGLVLKQAGINYNTYYLRKSEPERWKAEEVIAVMTVLQRLKL